MSEEDVNLVAESVSPQPRICCICQCPAVGRHTDGQNYCGSDMPKADSPSPVREPQEDHNSVGLKMISRGQDYREMARVARLENNWTAAGSLDGKASGFFAAARMYRDSCAVSEERDGNREAGELGDGIGISWSRPADNTRGDIVGVRELSDGRKEYLMHNEALCHPYYLAVSALKPSQPVESINKE